jgi:nucleotide-binding universal stress UspA family protein
MENKINVLIPTDFTLNAENALQYGLSFIDKFDSELFLLHVYEPYEPATEVPVFELIEKENEERRVKIKNSLDVSNSYAHRVNPDLSVNNMLAEGNAAEEILLAAKKRDINLIIIGYTIKPEYNRILFGNITKKVISKSSCPVLVVPQNASFNQIKNIVYASSNTEVDIWKINQLTVIASAFDASLHVLHLTSSKGMERDQEMRIFEEEVKKIISYKKMYFEYFHADNFVVGIEDYIKNNPIDLISMSTRTRLSLEKLYHPSLTEKISSHLVIPSLIFHYDQEE